MGFLYAWTVNILSNKHLITECNELQSSYSTYEHIDWSDDNFTVPVANVDCSIQCFQPQVVGCDKSPRIGSRQDRVSVSNTPTHQRADMHQNMCIDTNITNFANHSECSGNLCMVN